MSEPRAKLITCRIDPAHEVVPLQYREREGKHYCNTCHREILDRSDWYRANIQDRLWELGWRFGSACEGEAMVLLPVDPHHSFHWMLSSRKMKQWAKACGHPAGFPEQIQINNLLEIIGDPWRRPSRPLIPQTQDGIKAYRMASHFAETDGFLGMSILADILEEDGYDQQDVLDHLRGPVIHLPGCWALDVVLGRA